jgi:hypothetical protein
MATTSTEILQTQILEGRKILLKKENKKQNILIRFNNLDKDGKRKWRLIVDGIEFQTSEIKINVYSRTESIFLHEYDDFRHHIVVDASQVEFNNNIAIIS